MIVPERIEELSSMRKYPRQLSYAGNLELLQRRKISIVGSRKPTKYSRDAVYKMSLALAKRGICIVSGGAMGIDASAHMGASAKNTISVLPCGIDLRYPAVNASMLDDIARNGLLLSQFDNGFRAASWSFVLRNEMTVALGEFLIVGEADESSGSMRSVEFARRMGKEIYVLSQRAGESSGTNALAKRGEAKIIYDIDEFAEEICTCNDKTPQIDDFSHFCATNPLYDEAVAKYPHRVFEAELNGEIDIVGGRVILL